MKGRKKSKHIRTSKRGKRYWAGRGRMKKSVWDPYSLLDPEKERARQESIAEARARDTAADAAMRRLAKEFNLEYYEKEGDLPRGIASPPKLKFEPTAKERKELEMRERKQKLYAASRNK